MLGLRRGAVDVDQQVLVAVVHGLQRRPSGDVDQFARLRIRLDGCLTGSQLAKDRAADALTRVMIPEALDYPA